MNLRKLAKGQECQVRLPGICNFNPETTVLAHYRLSGTCGVGMKPPDLLGAWCCSDCHNVVDGRVPTKDCDFAWMRLEFAEGCLRTLNQLVAKGILPK